MAWDITPSSKQIKVWGRMSADYGESHYVGDGVGSKILHPRQDTSLVSVTPCIRSS